MTLNLPAEWSAGFGTVFRTHLSQLGSTVPNLQVRVNLTGGPCLVQFAGSAAGYVVEVDPVGTAPGTGRVGVLVIQQPTQGSTTGEQVLLRTQDVGTVDPALLASMLLALVQHDHDERSWAP